MMLVQHLTSGIISCHRECFLSEQLLHQKRLFCAYDRLRPSTIGDNGVYLMVGQLILSEYIEEGQYTCVHELKCKHIFMVSSWWIVMRR
ncbi:hypothetical protein DY000_02048522 [Brassica cretica]|uniref:Uncharacterized protein n=1 Tax=Brassica cretica TaxID=69181 RepID=A0ABQ7EV42_BRACR|nr:hypothetical protein DY000_02048522 [Brassica cretica]